MNAHSAPAVAALGKLRNKMEASESEGFMAKVNEVGINMVDLMMWLVIAALLLAAALQGIGYYQQAAWTYQAHSDIASVRTYMEAQYTLNNNTNVGVGVLVDGRGTGAAADTTGGNLKLTGKNKASVVTSTSSSWSASVESDGLQAAGKDYVFSFDSTTGNNVAVTAGSSATAW